MDFFAYPSLSSRSIVNSVIYKELMNQRMTCIRKAKCNPRILQPMHCEIVDTAASADWSPPFGNLIYTDTNILHWHSTCLFRELANNLISKYQGDTLAVLIRAIALYFRRRPLSWGSTLSCFLSFISSRNPGLINSNKPKHRTRKYLPSRIKTKFRRERTRCRIFITSFRPNECLMQFTFVSVAPISLILGSSLFALSQKIAS